MSIRDECRPSLVFNTVVLIMLVYNHMSANECIRDECRAKQCLQYSGPCNASLESYKCLYVYQG